MFGKRQPLPLPRSLTAQEMSINIPPKTPWLNISHGTHEDTHTLQHSRHQLLMETDGGVMAWGKEAGRRVHCSLLANSFILIQILQHINQLPWAEREAHIEVGALAPRQQGYSCTPNKGRNIPTLAPVKVKTYILWDGAGARCGAGVTPRSPPRSISIPVMPWAQVLYFPLSKCLSLRAS